MESQRAPDPKSAHRVRDPAHRVSQPPHLAGDVAHLAGAIERWAADLSLGEEPAGFLAALEEAAPPDA
jgi:hypothetical protein